MIAKLVLELIFFLWLIIERPFPAAAAAAPSMVMPSCQYLCGNVTIPYPFGIGVGCYHNESYAITCNASFNSSTKPFLSKFNLEVLEITLEGRLTVTINSPFASSCSSEQGMNRSSVWTSTDFRGSPFKFSSQFNIFTVVGCNNALLTTYDGEIQAGCTSMCRSDITTKGCYGINCCQTSIPSGGLDIYYVNISGRNTTDDNNCYSALLAETSWFPEKISSPSIIYKIKDAPVVLTVSFSIPSIDPAGAYYCDNSASYSYSYGYNELVYCACGWAHEGNPYIPQGCKVVEACANCEKDCDTDYKSGKYFCKHNNKAQIILGSSLGGGMLLLLLCGFCFWMYKFIKKRRIQKLKKKFFKRNGGLLLQQQISSDEGAIEKTVVFTSKELEKATDDFNENRILGQGGQGTVYKGMLSDGKIVAIKKSKVVDESQLGQFINEVVILSQINHRNIVQLLGCCLEAEVPLLVYEFISNGNLFELINDQNEEFPLSWKMRLQVATEVAGALSYLHSASSTPIFHRDIKSTNILLDEKYRAKVADFGTSRSIAIEQTHLTTLVHGTFGYLDPEYFQSSQFTEKSDVYSFGVVLAELLTGQKPISLLKSDEERSLATRFLLFLEEMRLFDLLDARVVEEATKEEIIVVADIARRCLSLNGKKRPTMKEVMMELEGIRMSNMPSVGTQNFHENECITEKEGLATSTSSTSHSGLIYHRAFSSDVDPLLFNTL